jgi:hypothetical protein
LVGWLGSADEIFDGPVDLSRVVDAQLPEPVVPGRELTLPVEDDAVELADGVGGVMQIAAIAGRGEKNHTRGRSKAMAKARISCASNPR